MLAEMGIRFVTFFLVRTASMSFFLNQKPPLESSPKTKQFLTKRKIPTK